MFQARPGSASTSMMSFSPATPRPVSPARLFDTRPSESAPGPKGAVPAGGTIDVQVTGVANVPANAQAVAITVTATAAAGPGFVTVWPAGRARPVASNLNVVRVGQTVTGEPGAEGADGATTDDAVSGRAENIGTAP